ncbi:MAG: DUF2007 domain-containing protein [Prevotella sp.]|nr:DUF2007 domain-containing protein [Prevotella sp.]
MGDLVTIKTSDFEAGLAIAKSYLIDNGIDCVINSEYLTISSSEGKAARLQVREEDYNRAAELLIRGGFSTKEDFDYSPDR